MTFKNDKDTHNNVSDFYKSHPQQSFMYYNTHGISHALWNPKFN